MSIPTALTKLYGIIGSPIQYSKSPVIHNLGFTELEIDAVFLAFESDESTAEDTIKAIRRLNLSGGGVTMPVKSIAASLMDKLSPEAKLIGAINVFKNENGELTGYNTDGTGLLMLLEQYKIPYKGEKIVLAGAGGAGRSVAIQIALNGAKEVVIFDIQEQRALELAEIINYNVKGCTARGHIAEENLLRQEISNGAAAYIDCTPLGMTPNEDSAMINDFIGVPTSLHVVDITYKPKQTKLLKLAEEHGCPVYNGEDMLYFQAVKAFQIFTGLKLPPSVKTRFDDLKTQWE